MHYFDFLIASRISLPTILVLSILIVSTAFSHAKDTRLSWPWRPPDERRPTNGQSQQDLVSPDEVHLEGVPKFLEHPKPLYYTIKGRPAVIECVAEPVSHVGIFCADKEIPYMNTNNPKNAVTVEKLDSSGKSSINGVRWRFSLAVRAKEVEEWFGDYYCHCTAWNQVVKLGRPKKVESERALIKEAYLEYQFQNPTETLVNVEVGKAVSLSCSPPRGLPIPEVFWMKDEEHINLQRENMVITENKELIIQSSRVHDTGNYTCVAKSLFGMERRAASITVNVFVHGDWSSWSEWSACDMSACLQHRKRECNAPTPVNGGQHCSNNLQGSNESRNCSGNAFSNECPLQILVEGHDPKRSQNILMYVGLCIAVIVFLCIAVVLILLARRKSTGHRMYQQEKALQKSNGYLGNQACLKPINNNNNSNNNVECHIPTALAQQPSNPLLGVNKLSTRLTPHMGPLPLIPLTGAPSQYNNYTSPYLGILTLPPAPASSFHTPSSTYTTIDREATEETGAGSVGTPTGNTMNHFQSKPLMGQVMYSPPNSCGDTARTSVTSPYGPGSISSNDDSAMMADRSRQSTSEESTIAQTELFTQHFHLNSEFDTVAWSVFTQDGGRLSLPESGVTLIVPMGAVHQGRTETIFVAVCRDIKDYPILSEHQTLLSSVIMFGVKSEGILLKPVVLSFPHCASLSHGGWQLNLWEGLSLPEQHKTYWRHSNIVNLETPDELLSDQVDPIQKNISLFTHVENNMIHIVHPQSHRYCLLGQSQTSSSVINSATPTAVKQLRLAAFSGPHSITSDLCIRVYLLSDIRDAYDNVLNLENRLGGQLLDTPKTLLLADNGRSVCFCIEEISIGWKSRLQNKYQEIPFHHVWSNLQSTNLHCSFTLEQVDPLHSSMMCKIVVYQEQNYAYRQSLLCSCDKNESPTNTLHRGNAQCAQQLNDWKLVKPEPLRIHPFLRRELCRILDPAHHRGNDWRALVRSFGMNGYIPFLIGACDFSRTDAILNLWEARTRDDTAVVELRHTLVSLNRKEIMRLLEKKVPLLRIIV